VKYSQIITTELQPRDKGLTFLPWEGLQ
jgi:hypothetical protein